jgi:ATP-dependent DNA helicase RecG
MDLNSPVDVLKGVGPKKKEALNHQGIISLGDLLYYFPRRHIDRTITKDIFLKTGDVVTLVGTVESSFLAHGKRSRLMVQFKTEANHKVTLVFFQASRYFQKIFVKGLSLVVSGKLEFFQGYQIVHPEYEILSSTNDEDWVHMGRIIPLYPTTEPMKQEGLDSKGLRKLVRLALDGIGDILPEILPQSLLKKRSLISRKQAMESIHFPESNELLAESKKRFKYEEFYFFNLLLNYKKSRREKIKRVLWPLPHSKTAEIMLKSLPFELTADQSKSIATILKMNSTDLPGACLLQGDVGSGKTLTALTIALHYVDNRIQVCFLAPTEILARQHFQTIQSYLKDYPFLAMDLLLGGEPKKTRLEKLHRLKSGETMILVATHSVLQPDIEFADLGLIIIDEQHKFGVDQRETLRSKGKNPDILAMTATPIPRTLSLAMYGDLELVTIASKPAGRKPIDTRWFGEDKRKGVYQSIRKYVGQGRQCYIVYPLVEESEKLDLKSCVEGYEQLKNEIFPDLSVGLLHGKMNADEKSRVMSEFQKNKIQILVTTTVVEVGVNVPNATILVVEHADRFGLSQLHQLRGRVGRAEWESFCILMTELHVSEEGKARLEALVESNDGFYLSEVDLKLRGPGELLGVRQSGLPDFRIADLVEDQEILLQAKEDASLQKDFDHTVQEEIQNRFLEGKLLFAN